MLNRKAVTLLDEYQRLALRTADYVRPQQESPADWADSASRADVMVAIYPFLGLAAEAGEVLGEIKKGYRPDRTADFTAIKLELGDVLWYVAVCAHELGLSLSEIAESNIRKLEARHLEPVEPAKPESDCTGA